MVETEIERREVYVQQMKTSLGETHPLVKLTLDCLEHFAEDRPSAVEMSRRLEEVERNMTQKSTGTKLELIQQVSQKEEMISQYKVQLSEKDEEIGRIRLDFDKVHAEKAEEQEQFQQFKELAALQQQQFIIKCEEVEQLSGQLRSLELQHGEEGSQGSRQRDVSRSAAKKVRSGQVLFAESP